jgi:hypothetical protein
MPTPPPAALLAFLRGLERRARTLATAQCGDPAQADLIWHETAAAFPAEAAGLPVASWPVRFWARLLSHPAMAVAQADASPLSALGPGPRAALLLRLVAGLDPRPAAEVLGVSEPTYRFALQRGLEQARAAGIDAQALQDLRAGLNRQPAPSTPGPADFAAAPAASVPTPAPPIVPVPKPTHVPPIPASAKTTAPSKVVPVPAPAPRRGRTAAIVGVALVLVAALVTWRWFATTSSPLPSTPAPTVQALPAGEPAPLSPVTHPDYALVAASDDAALAADLELLSWLAAGEDLQPATPAPAAGPESAP